ncbi:hypothetical protein [Phycicoccus sp. Soil802]|uniref:hypothetical protein n=1 Tax=Phycicoccus sp. Soil802 TaxID=1736414 RepID=UPI0012F8B9C5|nr:hypothetical protein [Phycicoccus sp. Soil802]
MRTHSKEASLRKDAFAVAIVMFVGLVASLSTTHNPGRTIAVYVPASVLFCAVGLWLGRSRYVKNGQGSRGSTPSWRVDD